MKTIVCLITPPLTGAVAVIRMSGEESLPIAQAIFSRKITTPNYVYYGNILAGQEIVDQVLLTYFKSPKSFTGEDVIEISCHGSMLIVNQIIALILSKGARYAERGEFSSRAFYNNKIDLVQAESINSLVLATTPEQKKLAMYSLNGDTSRKITPMIKALADILSNIEVNIDYPEYQDIEEVTFSKIISDCQNISLQIQSFLNQSKKSQYIVHGINVALVGMPNTGKSSLLNALLNQEKAIVSDIPGTTRDIVEGTMNLEGLPLHLLDTAGIHQSENKVEQIGIKKSQESMEKADLVLFIRDASQEMTQEEKEILSSIQDKKYLIIHNKSDLITKKDPEKIYISALNKDLHALKTAIANLFDLSTSDLAPSLCSAREIGLLTRANLNLLNAIKEAKDSIPLDLIAVSIKSAYDDLKSIIGQTIQVDLSEEIFSRFCVGK